MTSAAQSSADPLPRSIPRLAVLLPLAFLVVGLLVTVLATHQTIRFIERDQQAGVAADITQLRNDLRLHVHRHIDVLRTYQAAFAANPDSSQTALERIAQVLELDERLPGIHVVGNIVALPSPEPLYSVRYVYPEALAKRPSAPAVGDALRQEAVRRARDTGGLAATPPVPSTLDPQGSPVIMVYLPLYTGGTVPATLEERQRLYAGAAFLSLKPDRLLESLFDHTLTPADAVRLQFEGYGDATPASAPPQVLYARSPAAQTVAPARTAKQYLSVAGTAWSIELTVPQTREGAQLWLPWAVAAVGALLSILSAGALYALQRSRRLSQQLARHDRRRRREMQTALHLRHRAIEASANAIVIASATRPGYPVEYVNPAFERMTGYSANEVLGQSLRTMHGTDTQQKGLEELRLLLRDQREGETTLRNYRKDGQLYWTRVHIAPVLDDHGTVTHFVAAKYDITETLRYQETLEFQAWHDALTHLPNRHLLRRTLQEKIQSAGPDSTPFWVAFLDLDNFKLVNDTLGHTQGDLVLLEISRRLQEALHEHDIVARRGGDEFVFILFDHAPPRNALATLNRIMSAVSRPLKLDTQRFFPSCSIGVAIHPQDGNDPDLLIQRADMAMYHAKQLGRNNFQFYSDALQHQATRRVELERDLRAALTNEEFELHFQPQVRLHDDAVIGVEALVRWRHPERGLLSPARFIPLAEETGLIVPLGEWILRAACRQAHTWRDAGLPPLRVAVNISARQFNDDQLPALIENLLREHELPADLLELELTETMLMTDVKTASITLNRLKALGIALALDDFGTGYSSLAQLKRFPLDMIKIDRSFVANITIDQNDDTIVQAIIKMAHNLGMTALAEGVETTEQEDALRTHGCDMVQGYLISKPLPATELEAWLSARHVVT